MENDGVVISIGTVNSSNIRDGRSYVEISDGGKYPFRFVFSDNDKKKRGNHVKKLKLRRGQTVIAIGARRRFEIIGWELFREAGIVRNDKELAIIGTLKRKLRSGNDDIVIVRLAGRDYHFFGKTTCEPNTKVVIAAKYMDHEFPDITAIKEIKEE